MLFLLLRSGMGIGSGECYFFVVVVAQNYLMIQDLLHCHMNFNINKFLENGFGTLIGSSLELQTVL